jgi:chemotaxis protein histidine kinase CheA
MNINSIASVYSNVTTNNISNNSIVSTEIAKGNNTEVLAIYDSLDLSLNYSEDAISSIIDDIKSTLDSGLNLIGIEDSTSISDYASQYGRLLNKIKSSTALPSEDLDKITTILDNTFDAYTKRISERLAGNIASFFNSAYNAKLAYEKQGTDMGITGEKIIDKAALEANINAMFSSAKAFYKNNSSATKEELEAVLQKTFSKTESIEKLSYKDFNSLQKAIDISNNKGSGNNPPDLSFYLSPYRRMTAMEDALNALKADGASEILITSFEKAKDQNTNYHLRIDAYKEIRFSFDKQLEELFGHIIEFEAKLEELEKQRKEVLKKNEEEMRKLNEMLKKQTFQARMFNMKNGINQTEDLQEQHEKNIQLIDTQKLEFESILKGYTESFKTLTKQYNDFMKSPASSIDNYLKAAKTEDKNSH